MISFDLECTGEHRFEGIFKDYQAFDEQLKKEMIECPVCGDKKIKRLFTGCSIQTGASAPGAIDTHGCPADTQGRAPQSGEEAPLPVGSSRPVTSIRPEGNTQNIFEMIRVLREYVTKNYENVGRNFADTARAIHYGVEEHRDIYGESTPQEIKDLVDEGISILPLPDVDTAEN